MRIVQFTDLHLDLSEGRSMGIEVRTHFEEILDDALRQEPDHLVISGDICLESGDKAIYKWLKSYTDGLPLTLDLIPGNHDSLPLLAEVFGLEYLLQQEELYYARRLSKQLCIFMDSSKASHSETQLNWLKRQLKQNPEEVFIFTHYPPCKADVPFMDHRYALKDSDQLMPILLAHPYPVNVFCGHYHVDKVLRHQQVNIFITPSLYFQLDPFIDTFQIDHKNPGYRIIDCLPYVSTTVRYLPGTYS